MYLNSCLWLLSVKVKVYRIKKCDKKHCLKSTLPTFFIAIAKTAGNIDISAALLPTSISVFNQLSIHWQLSAALANTMALSKMSTSFLAVLSLILLVDHSPHSSLLVTADCCFPTYLNCSGTMEVACLDCSPPTPFCGSDQCNVVGCNCTCRAPPPKIYRPNGQGQVMEEGNYFFYNLTTL